MRGLERDREIPEGTHPARMEFGAQVITDHDRLKLTGTVPWVELEAGLDGHDHLIPPEDRIRVAMAIQKSAGGAHA